MGLNQCERLPKTRAEARRRGECRRNEGTPNRDNISASQRPSGRITH